MISLFKILFLTISILLCVIGSSDISNPYTKIGLFLLIFAFIPYLNTDNKIDFLKLFFIIFPLLPLLLVFENSNYFLFLSTLIISAIALSNSNTNIILRDIHLSMLFISLMAIVFFINIASNYEASFLGRNYEISYAQRRFSSFFANSTAYGVFLALTIVLGYETKFKYRNIAALAFVGFIFLTASRTPIFLLLIYVALVNLKPRNFSGVLFFGLVITLTFIFIQTFQENIYFARRFLYAEDYSTLGGRLDKFNSVLNNYDLNIYQSFFGTGIGNFNEYLKQINFTAHSGILRIFIENGIICSILFILQTIIFLRHKRDKLMIIILSAQITTSYLLGLSFINYLYFIIMAKRLNE